MNRSLQLSSEGVLNNIEAPASLGSKLSMTLTLCMVTSDGPLSHVKTGLCAPIPPPQASARAGIEQPLKQVAVI